MPFSPVSCSVAYLYCRLYRNPFLEPDGDYYLKCCRPRYGAFQMNGTFSSRPACQLIAAYTSACTNIDLLGTDTGIHRIPNSLDLNSLYTAI